MDFRYNSLEPLNEKTNHLADVIDEFYESHFPNKGFPNYNESYSIEVLKYLINYSRKLVQEYEDNIKIKNRNAQ